MGFLDSLSSVLDSVGTVANVASAGYNLYSGIQNASALSDYTDALAGTAALQDKMASEQWAIQKPLMEQQAALTGTELTAAQQYLPGLLDQQYALAGKSLTSQDADLDLYDSSRGVTQAFFDQSLQGVDKDAAMSRAGNAVEQAMADAAAENTRNLSRRGVSLSSNQAAATSQRDVISKALAKAGARTNAWNAADNLNYSRLGNATNVRAGLSADVSTPVVAGVSLGDAGTTASRAGSTYANLANSASRAASDAFTGAGYSLGRL